MLNRSSRILRLILVLAVIAVMATVFPTGRIQAASLVEVTNFGTNPSNLRMHLYVPDNVRPNPAILVAVHYCTGSGPAFYSGTEFASLANQYGFIIIYPSATRSGSCYDVSSPQALTRNGGSDPVGIMSMVNYVIQNHNADANRVFVTGASSGGMMTNVLLGDYPDVFKAGAAFMGVPFACFATTDGSSWNSTCSSGNLIKTPQEWGNLVRAAFPGYTGPRPRMQVFHGTTDTTLAYPNFQEQIKQWTNVLGVSQTPSFTDTPQSGWTRTRYGGTGINAPVEGISIQGVGHSLPLAGQALMAIRFFGLDTTSNATPTRTSTRTNTPVGPTPTRTNTPSVPTNTPVGPTVTRTNTPVVGGDGSPYNGTAVSLPGTVQAENYNTGGQGVAYNDTTAANEGNVYRTTEGVDVEATTDTGGGYHVGWTTAGEWLKYTVNVQTSGTYTLTFRVASQIGGSFHLEVDGVNVTGALAMPNTGGWQTYTSVTRTGVNLTAGQHVLRLVIDGSYGNFNWISVSNGSVPTNTAVGPTATRTNTPIGPTATRTNTPVIVPTNTGVAPTATASGNTCSPVTSTITAPFNQDGAGTFCWRLSSFSNYLNSWNLTSLTINGVDFTNKYATPSQLPAKASDGYWYISYQSTVAWGHFEVR